MKLEDLVTYKRKDILAAAARHGARNVRIFGSVARRRQAGQRCRYLGGLEPGRSLFDLGGLLTDLQELLGCKVDVVTEKGLRDPHSASRLEGGRAAMRDDRERLLDIQEAIAKVEKYAAQRAAGF